MAFTALPAMADSPGQIAGGPIYQIKNLTQNTAFATTATANACDNLEYAIQLDNPDYGMLNNVEVSVNLPSTVGTSNVSTMTASSSNGSPSTTTASATLNLTSAQSVSYVSGSTKLLNSTGGLIENLPDGITQSGVNIGSLAGSALEYINFEVKVSCPQTPPAPVYTCNLLNVSTIADRQVQANVQYSAANGATFQSVTYNFGDNSTVTVANTGNVTHSYTNYGSYNITASVLFSVNGSNQTVTSANCAKTVSFTAPPTTPTTPSQLVNTGPGSVVGIFAGTAVLATLAHYLFRRQIAKRSLPGKE